MYPTRFYLYKLLWYSRNVVGHYMVVLVYGFSQYVGGEGNLSVITLTNLCEYPLGCWYLYVWLFPLRLPFDVCASNAGIRLCKMQVLKYQKEGLNKRSECMYGKSEVRLHMSRWY
jgi:hypothetical protein